MALNIIDRGSGAPIVVIPGVQGRWEWMEPAIDALSKQCRVITFSLADEPTSGAIFDEQRGFWSYVDQVSHVLDALGIEQAAICGVSYGGLIAAAFAARHPRRTTSLLLVSALSPGWTPDRRVAFFLRAPRLLTPLFLLGSLRMYREMRTAAGRPGMGVWLSVSHAYRALTHMFSPLRMARRARMVPTLELREELSHLSIPTSIITGEPQLDRVVPVAATLQYAQIWPHAKVATIPRTGHLGLTTRPAEFARLVVPFVESTTHIETRRQVG